MLVYLDTGDLANLQKLSEAGAASWLDFLDDWRRNGLQLALSLHHLQEIAQLASEESRKARLNFISLFPDIVYSEAGSAHVVHAETTAQLLAVGSGSTPDYTQAVGAGLFKPTSAKAIEDLSVATVEAFQAIRIPLTMASEAENLGRGTRPTPLSKITADKIDAGAIPGLVDTAIRLHGMDPAWRDFAIDLTTQIAALGVQHGNMRLGLAAAFGLAQQRCLAEVPDADLARFGTVVSWVREEGVPDVQPFITQLNPYDCPALRLVFALERAQAANTRPAPVSNEIDSDHLHFAPYVGAMTVDKRTLAYLAQEAHRSPRLLPAGSLASLIKSAPPGPLMIALKARLVGSGEGGIQPAHGH
jgi:hypothetical protein